MSDKTIKKSFIQPKLIHQFNYHLKNHNFDQARNIFYEIETKYLPVQQLALIKAIYLYYVGLDNDITKFLYTNFDKFNNFLPPDGKFYSWGTRREELDIIYQQENIAATFKTLKSLNLNEGDNKIPLISNYVWVTASDFSEEIRTEKFWDHNRYLESKVKMLSDYQHIMWVNDINLIPKSVVIKLESMNIEIKTLVELYKISKSSEQNNNLEYLINTAQISAELKQYAISTDIIRYQALKELGGIYSDGDYRIYRDPRVLFSNYEAIIGYESSTVAASFNGFYAVKPQHPISIKILDLTARNLQAEDSPYYPKKACCQTDKTFLNAGIPLFSVAVQKALNPQTDALLPIPMIVHGSPDNILNISSMGIIGNDDWSGSWKDYTELDYGEKGGFL